MSSIDRSRPEVFVSILVNPQSRVLVQGITGAFGARHTQLSLAYGTQVVADLDAQAAGVADRLKKIGERVGLPAHARSDSYFQMAVPMSNLLIAIESGVLLNNAGALYNGPYTPDLLDIITHWSIATGRNIKDPALRQPLGVLAAAGTGAGTLVGGNGAPVNRIAVALR